jgi:hypothetical protein
MKASLQRLKTNNINMTIAIIIAIIGISYITCINGTSVSNRLATIAANDFYIQGKQTKASLSYFTASPMPICVIMIIAIYAFIDANVTANVTSVTSVTGSTGSSTSGSTGVTGVTGSTGSTGTGSGSTGVTGVTVNVTNGMLLTTQTNVLCLLMNK